MVSCCGSRGMGSGSGQSGSVDPRRSLDVRVEEPSTLSTTHCRIGASLQGVRKEMMRGSGEFRVFSWEIHVNFIYYCTGTVFNRFICLSLEMCQGRIKRCTVIKFRFCQVSGRLRPTVTVKVA